MIKTTTLHVHHAFQYISLTFKKWNLQIWRFMEDLDTCTRQRFSFLFSNLNKILKNSTPGKAACIWAIERAQINATTFERTQIHLQRRFHCRLRPRYFKTLSSIFCSRIFVPLVTYHLFRSWQSPPSITKLIVTFAWTVFTLPISHLIGKIIAQKQR